MSGQKTKELVKYFDKNVNFTCGVGSDGDGGITHQKGSQYEKQPISRGTRSYEMDFVTCEQYAPAQDYALFIDM